jgi:prepilin peptidase CpaA
VFAGSFGLSAGVVFTVVILYAALQDIRSRRIPNVVVAVLGGLGIMYSVMVEPGTSSLIRALGGFATGLACWLPFYALGWLGAGDVKLFAAAGAWLGPLRTVEGALIGALAGAVLAIGWMIWSYGFRRTAATLSVATAAPSILAPAGREVDKRRTLPYGVALAVGALAAAWLPRTVLFQ